AHRRRRVRPGHRHLHGTGRPPVHPVRPGPNRSERPDMAIDAVATTGALKPRVHTITPIERRAS
ncbi:Mce family protein Mce3F, partial [Mycobacterium marinum]